MTKTLWPRTTVSVNGKEYEAIAPIIISASRATDIPAFYASQFMNCLRKGYLYWQNPFNNKKTLVSLKRTKLIVFWTKNPKALIPYLDEIAEMGISFYFNYTLNNYEKEGFEPGIPQLEHRIKTFIELADKIGKENIIWRFDPIIIADIELIDSIIDRIENLAQILGNYTNKLVFSFVDTNYKKVKSKFKNNLIELPELSNNDKLLFASHLTEKLKNIPFEISTCAESVDFLEYGITHNKCVDDQVICSNFKNNHVLLEFINKLKISNHLKDKGQREFCSCIPSKDIGRYNSCGYACLYCYAMKAAQSCAKDDIFN